jgi:predicted RNase H-like HicB family nuclease
MPDDRELRPGTLRMISDQSCPGRYSRKIEGMMKDYHINVFFSEVDEGWIADIPDLKYCSASGETPEEALREVQTAKALWLEVARSEGKPIPPPRYRAAIYQRAS